MDQRNQQFRTFCTAVDPNTNTLRKIVINQVTQARYTSLSGLPSAEDLSDPSLCPIKPPRRLLYNMQQNNERLNDDWADTIKQIASHQDRQAFTRLFAHFGPKIKAYALALNSQHTTPEMADELVQEVMIKVWQKAGYFNADKANASTWIFAIARNCRIDYLRKMKRISSPLNSDDLWPVFEEPDPVSLLELEKSSLQIQNVVSTLPPEQIAILKEVYIEGKTHAEVSKQSGLPLGTVKSRLRLAMERLRSTITTPEQD